MWGWIFPSGFSVHTYKTCMSVLIGISCLSMFAHLLRKAKVYNWGRMNWEMGQCHRCWVTLSQSFGPWTSFSNLEERGVDCFPSSTNIQKLCDFSWHFITILHYSHLSIFSKFLCQEVILSQKLFCILGRLKSLTIVLIRSGLCWICFCFFS